MRIEQQKAREIAGRIMAEGKPFASGWSDEGDGESGPSGGAIYGIRWGQLYLSIRGNGMGGFDSLVLLESRKCGLDPWGGEGFPLISEFLSDPDLRDRILCEGRHAEAENRRAAAEAAR